MKRLKEFDAKIAAYEEEQEKTRKALELEYRQLKSQIEGICRQFDLRLQEIFFDRLKAEMQVHVRDLMIIRLSSSSAEMLRLEDRRAALSKEVEALKVIYDTDTFLCASVFRICFQTLKEAAVFARSGAGRGRRARPGIKAHSRRRSGRLNATEFCTRVSSWRSARWSAASAASSASTRRYSMPC